MAQEAEESMTTLLEVMRAVKATMDEIQQSGQEQQRDLNNLRQQVQEEALATQPQEVAAPAACSRTDAMLVEAGTMKLHDLPTFSGKAEDWPLFYANFKDSTELFRYNDRQNLMRLHKCLVGDAREAVASMLIYPEGVSQAMEELEFRFGRSDLLIRCQLNKLQNFPAMTENKLESVVAFSTNVRNVVAFLTSAKSEQHLSNPLLLEQLVSKLPPSKQFEWARCASVIKPYPTVRDFAKWLTELARVVATMSTVSVSLPRGAAAPPRRVMHVSENSTEKLLQCYCCHAAHVIANCKKFHQASVQDRWNVVKKEKLCFACLRRGHNVLSCRSKKPCGVNECSRFHHASLHEESKNQVAASQIVHPTQPVLNCSTPRLRCNQLFKIIPLQVCGPNGKMDVFAMLDEGSAVSMVEENVANQLGLRGQLHPLTLQWYAEGIKTEQSRRVTLEVVNRTDGEKFAVKNVHTVKKLNLPAQSFDKSEFDHLELLPIEDYVNAKPVVLIGLDNAHLTAAIVTVQAQQDHPLAIKTKLGWVAYGPVKSSSRTMLMLHIREAHPLDELHQLVAEYFNNDRFGAEVVRSVPESEEDQRARTIMHKTTQVRHRYYETGLLWRSDTPKLPASYEAAVGRLCGIERRMKSDAEFARRYHQEMSKYFDKGYAKILASNEIVENRQPVWYLPHFAVQSPYKPDKLRIVFDAAAKVQSVALNSCLLKGPERAKSLLNILFRFRQGVIGVAADIREMFSQVKMRAEDQHAQRFLWRTDPSLPIQHCCMTTMIFGAACSPCCAEFVKNHNASRFKERYPAAVDAIVEKHYVDDFVCSFNEEATAVEICRQVVAIHAEAGFELRNFISNSDQVQQALKGATKYDTINMEKQATSEKVLGMYWNVRTDTFEFRTQFHRIPSDVLNTLRAPTKREFLGIVMSVFDPYGLLADVMATSKILMQQIWRSHVEWDESIPEEIDKLWKTWWNSFQDVRRIKVPRPYATSLDSLKELELHMFVDASQVLFAAAGYFRIPTSKGWDVAFVAAKTRNAPLKLMSIPRLELQAAVLGTRLSQTICHNHDVNITSVTLWTDSNTVWHWIQSTKKKYKPFVGHRIAEILESTQPSQWRWIPTEFNVADDATRQQSHFRFNGDSRWLKGPDFLKQEEAVWPNFVIGSPPGITEEEVQPQLIVNVQPSRLIDYDRFSSYTKLKKTIAWVLRFKNMLLRSEGEVESRQQSIGPLTVAEVDEAEQLLCQMVQRECYTKEVNMLNAGLSVPKGSSMYSLSPYFENDGLIRVKGRLDEATYLPFTARRPIILPQNHAVSRLIMQYYHEKNYHQNKAITINETRQRFWIVRAQAVLRAVEKKCLRCQLDRVKPATPQMGQLPVDRITPYVRPFAYTGVDLFGPLTVTIGRCHAKRWAVIFTCLTIRAVHLEVAADLSTDAFIVCLRNFINRRGTPVRIRSDNGTNFIGAQKELQNAEKLLDVDRIQAEAVNRGIDWVFNCPSNPSSGGCWERLIRIIKRLLHKTLHEVAPRVETLQSVLIEAENIVNARPLTDIPLTTIEDEPLTPNHFLLGCANSTQTPQPVDMKICLKKQWRIAQNLKDRLWKRWTVEFLPQLLHRQKWHDKVPPIREKDVVIICEPSLPRSQWQKGIVLKVYPAKDGQVRFAEVKTATGLLRRPSSKLAVLTVGES